MTESEVRAFRSDYYDVDTADKFLATLVEPGLRRWRCLLCGFPQGDFPADDPHIGVFGCGACGQHCVRPIEEFDNNTNESRLPEQSS